LIVLLALSGTSAFAAGVCQGGALTTYLQGGFTCTQDNGILTFKSFVFTGALGGLNSDQIFVSPVDVPGQVGFMFTGAGNLNFSVQPGQNATYVLSYFIDPPPVIHSEQLDLDPFGSVSLVEDLCVTAFPCAGGNSLGKLTVDNSNPPTSLHASIVLGNLNALGIQNTLTLNGGTGGANSHGFNNVTFVNPEPSTILLAASGLLGLLAFRSRAKLRKIRF
jgi:hypothetical protein